MWILGAIVVGARPASRCVTSAGCLAIAPVSSRTIYGGDDHNPDTLGGGEGDDVLFGVDDCIGGEGADRATSCELAASAQ